MELIAMNDLDWEKLTTILTSRGRANESEIKLENHQPQPILIPVKKEVAYSKQIL